MRIFYMGKEVRDSKGRWSSFKKKTANFIRKTVFVIGSIGIMYGVSYIQQPLEVHADGQPIIVTNVTKTDIKDIPIMQRIQKCESPNGHFEKGGKVVIRDNKNGTTDIGKYQINTVWLRQAAELKLNLLDEKDNEKMALWIYENKGTAPWYSSEACWRK